MIANLSIDLDNQWSYLKTAEVEKWRDYPTYFPLVVPRIISELAKVGMATTIFVVGRDLDREENRKEVRSLANAGHRLANHSMDHHSWLNRLKAEEIRADIETAHHAIAELNGTAPIGFRGPSFSDSPEIRQVLCDNGYAYCASSFPSSVGPMARAFYLLKTKRKAKKGETEQLFGNWTDMFLSNRPYKLTADWKQLWMFPVTVQPVTRLPFHFTYLNFLTEKSPAIARMYLRKSIWLCKIFRVQPSLLLHPLDFLGKEDEPDLNFFPGMKLTSQAKLSQLAWFLTYLKKHFNVVTMEKHLEILTGKPLASSPTTVFQETVES